jgi:hypothetical protein
MTQLALEKELRKTVTDGTDIDILKKAVQDRVIQKYKGPDIGDLVETHNYKFIGRAGQFTPIIDGAGGGRLVREQNGSMVNVTDTSNYRWLESEMVRLLHMEDAVNEKFYINKVDEAIETISKYGDFNWFVSNDANPD